MSGLKKPIVSDLYPGAISSETEWSITLARAVYEDCNESPLLGVVGVDVILDQMLMPIENAHVLQSGYSILATAESGECSRLRVFRWNLKKRLIGGCLLTTGKWKEWVRDKGGIDCFEVMTRSRVIEMCPISPDVSTQCETT